MALKVKAKEQLIKIGKYADTYRYVMAPELYIALSQSKVIQEAALRSGVSRGVMQACWDAAGEVIKAWATEGHAVALPGLGTMRFGLRAKSVADVNDVKASLISTRRIIFTPASDLKEELAKTAVQITCFDRNGVEVKRVTSSDEGKVEDPEDDNDGSGSTVNGSGSEPENSGNQNPETPASGEAYTIKAAMSGEGGSVVIKKNGSVVDGDSVQATASDTVVIEAVAENGNYEFLGWSDGNTQNPRTIQPSADMDVTASFMNLNG